MAQTTLLIDTLKRALKAHGKTYADVARYLDLSEASVKRLFAEKNFSLYRLEQVCQLIGLEISDLVQMMNGADDRRLKGLSIDQEQEIAGNIELMLVTVCVLNRWTLEEIVDYFHIDETRCIKHLARLDRLRIIELLPKNRVKLLVSANFKWRENGPIQRFFQDKLEADFFRSRFDRKSEKLIVVNGMLADSSNAVFQRKMEHLAREFDEMIIDDAQLSLDKRNGATVVLAIREWKYGLFEHFIKK